VQKFATGAKIRRRNIGKTFLDRLHILRHATSRRSENIPLNKFTKRFCKTAPRAQSGAGCRFLARDFNARLKLFKKDCRKAKKQARVKENRRLASEAASKFTN